MPTQVDEKEKEPTMTIVQEQQSEIIPESSIKDDNDELMMEITEENKKEIVINKEEQVEKDHNIENKGIESEVAETADVAEIKPTTISVNSEFNVNYFMQNLIFKIANKILHRSRTTAMKLYAKNPSCISQLRYPDIQNQNIDLYKYTMVINLLIDVTINQQALIYMPGN